MNRPIQVGDLVQVVKPMHCCGGTNDLGRVFVVHEFYTDGSFCSNCGTPSNGELILFDSVGEDGAHPHRLKRIPPLEELEGQRTEEKLREPALHR